MAHLGDFDTSAVVYGKFSTYRPSSGASFTLGGTPALSVYKDNSTTQSTTGVTLTADFDSVTGLNHFAIDTSADGTFYSAGSFFDIVITTGTVDSVSVTGSVVGSFTIRKNSALKPATAGRTVVVDAAGLVDANAVKLGPSGSGTAQTARDIGTSVLLSSGTGTGQISLSSGGVSLSTSGLNAAADAVWDEAASGHTASGSFGQFHQVIRTATAQAGAGTTITLDASASATDDFYNSQIIQIVGGTGANQSRIISDYVGSTKVATVATWGVNPSSDSVFVIKPFGSIPGASAPTAAEVADQVWDELRADHVAAGSFGQYFAALVRSGTAQAGGASTITLDSGASATNDIYNYNQITIISGTGAGQSRQISDYVGSSKVATIGVAWTTNPSSDSVFLITPLGVDAATVAAIADAVWDEVRSGHATAGTFGEYTFADAIRISGDATSADNLESYTDGTTPMPVNVTQLSGDATAADNLEAALDGTGGVAITATFTGNLTGSVDSVTGAVGSVTGTVTANLTQVSGDATAADNLEALLDGTGGVTLVASAITLTTPITANMTQISGDATAADNLESFTDGSDRIGVDVREINSTVVNGNGAGTPWGP